MSSSLLCSQFHWRRLSLASDVDAPQVVQSCPRLLVVMFNASCLPCLSNINPPLLSPVPHYSPLDLWCTPATVDWRPRQNRDVDLAWPDPWFGMMSWGCRTRPNPDPCDYGLDIMVTKIKWRTYIYLSSLLFVVCNTCQLITFSKANVGTLLDVSTFVIHLLILHNSFSIFASSWDVLVVS